MSTTYFLVIKISNFYTGVNISIPAQNYNMYYLNLTFELFHITNFAKTPCKGLSFNSFNRVFNNADGLIVEKLVEYVNYQLYK